MMLFKYLALACSTVKIFSYNVVLQSAKRELAVGLSECLETFSVCGFEM